MDCQAVVFNELDQDPVSYINDRSQELYEHAQGKVISVAADLLFPTEGEVPINAQSFRKSSFCSAAAIAMAAFLESDLPNGILVKAYEQLVHSKVPSSFIFNTSDEMVEFFEHVALLGNSSHPEIRPHLELVSQYFTEATQDASYGSIAQLGGGVTAYLLDLSTEKIEKSKIIQEFGVDIDSVDWNELTR